ncbi:MAG: nuclear transport factor 2 family protein [Verrucomicrobia bacterium]|jgi:hypothetical protein|nr:nuclear transport factor 2 family protein [Verrucomicrobiota bacterium]MDA0725230.1 nuclear transport factor 2 family protein [Verrucomicrobiota bacterium]MDA1047067.1 nuclear transport factor 2 family protein [Verrucomicrobiota bacterium]
MSSQQKFHDNEALAAYVEGLKSHDIATIAESLAENVKFVTSVKTMGKPAILEFLNALYAGFPDWNYDHDNPVRHGDGSYSILWRQGGTHTAMLSFPGFDAVPATGKTVVIPKQRFFYRVDSSGLTEIRPDPVPGGAPRGIFEQIGVEQSPL